ncbi:phage holin family protein [Burkholderia cenocepacia]|uniref:phage holin family protein n=1 Tax=Burkholderia cenocepacia TaxID=95486 RepID=UPI0023B9A86C|nr:phage holin family protein [Burkholderia cenocepacia]MDF0506594.1 phage holin family protein [Burkholderia cenocepacia]
MPATLQLKRFITTWLVLFWSAAAYAAQETFANDLTSIPPAAIAISCVLALIGGAANTARKIADPTVVIKSAGKEIVKDVFTSIAVGLMIFFLGSYLNWASVAQAGIITLSGYGGSRVLEPALSMLLRWFARLSGMPDKTQSPEVE